MGCLQPCLVVFHVLTCACTGRLHPCVCVLQDNQEEFEIDLNDDEPEFLKGHSSRSGIEMSPVKIVKNPEGSMQRAAMTQVGLGAVCKQYIATV